VPPDHPSDAATGPTPARALAVFHLAATSGPSRSLHAELRWLAATGCELDVVVPGRGAVADAFGEFARVTELDYEALTLPRDPLVAGRGARRASRESERFRDLIRGRRPELVVISSAMLPAALVAARRERVPAIVYAGELFGAEGAGQRSPAAAIKALGGRALTRMTGSLAAAVLACSRTVAAQYERAGGAGVSVLYPPIPDHSGGDGAAFRTELGIGADERCLVAIGNVTYNRGQDVLIEALPAIRARVTEARAVIVGDPHPRPQDREYRQSLNRLADRLGVRGAVSFAAHTDRVADVFAAADVVVNPRRSGEAFGRVACEALVAGRPVVAMREGAVGEVLRDGETALLVAPGDSAALAGAAVRLLEDATLRERLVAEGRRDVLRRFSPQRSLAEFSRVVEKVAEAAAGRADVTR
jgi:glycosyltransferase involved in cell wall biosynthesis